VTGSGATTFVNRPSWRRPHISWIGQFARALLSCRLLNPAMQGQPFSEYIEICGRCLQRFGLPDGFDRN
jgi:hypothetical protein